MNEGELPIDIAAFHHAAQAVLAFEWGIIVKNITIVPDDTGRTYTRLEPLKYYCDLHEPKSVWTICQVEYYVTTLLGGIVGRQLRVEAHFGYKSKCTGQVKLHKRYLAKLRKFDEHDTDRAFAIALAWLKLKDGGNTIATIERLWKRARFKLRSQKNIKRLAILAERLDAQACLSGSDIRKLFLG
jgi:hypothetical protein